MKMNSNLPKKNLAENDVVGGRGSDVTVSNLKNNASFKNAFSEIMRTAVRRR